MMTSDECCTSVTETSLVLAGSAFGEEPHILPHGHELAQYHEGSDQQGPDGEPANRIVPRPESYDQEQAGMFGRRRGREAD